MQFLKITGCALLFALLLWGALSFVEISNNAARLLPTENPHNLIVILLKGSD